MGRSVIMLDPVKQGVYELPECIVFNADEPMDTLESLIAPAKERGKLNLDGKTFMVNIYVEKVVGLRYPYLLMDDLERLR